MILVRNENGSHNPDEDMKIDDLMDAAAIVASWILADADA